MVQPAASAREAAATRIYEWPAWIHAFAWGALLDRFRSSRKLDARWLAWSFAALVAAVICRQLDLAGRFTGPDAWLQGHALWHVLTSLSLGCTYLYYRSEVTTAPDHAVNGG